MPAQDIEWLAVRVYRWLVNLHRKLVTGITLAELAGDDLPQYEDDAELRLGGFAKQAADRGAQFGLARTAAHGALACPHWWGHPRWPDLVDRLLIVLDDPANEHWGQGGELRRCLPAERPSRCGGARSAMIGPSTMNCARSPIAITIATPAKAAVAVSVELVSVAGRTAGRPVANSALVAARAWVRRIRVMARVAGICAAAMKKVLLQTTMPISPGPAGVCAFANGARMLENSAPPVITSAMLAAIRMRKSRSWATAR